MAPQKQKGYVMEIRRRHLVQSYNLMSVGYDPDTETLEAELVSGSVYHYARVKVKQYVALLNAPNIGHYFETNIKEKHKKTLFHNANVALKIAHKQKIGYFTK